MALANTVKFIGAATLCAVAGMALYLFNRHESDAARQFTDNASVQADFTLVAPRVAGQLAELRVKDHQQVKAGDLLAVIDDRDWKVAAQSAQANVAAAQAAIAGLQAQLRRQTALIRQAAATVSADEAAIRLAQANWRRYRDLAGDGAGSRQEAQQADAQLRIHQAARERDVAAHSAARLQVDILQADLAKAQATLAQGEAALAGARLNLSHTRIVAPISGTVGRRTARVGAYVTAGSPLLALVPLDALYVTANYRETQLARLRPGQPVSIAVDTLPGVALKGRVASLAPASGLSFAPVAPQNATGNFTKVVQRLPVRIELEPGQPALGKLRVGMSVQATVATGAAEKS